MFVIKACDICYLVHVEERNLRQILFLKLLKGVGIVLVLELHIG